LCNQTFIAAESLVSPVYCSSFASCLRAVRLLSRSSAFIRSTIDVRHASFSPFAAAALSTIAATSTVCAGALAGVAVGAGDPPGAKEGEAFAACAEPWPKILLIMLPKMLIMDPPERFVTDVRFFTSIPPCRSHQYNIVTIFGYG